MNLILIFIVDSNIIIKKIIIFARTFKTCNMNLTHYLPINTTEKVDLILSELLKENLLFNKAIEWEIGDLIKGYKLQLYFIKQMINLKRIKHIAEKKREIDPKVLLTPDENDSYSKKKLKSLIGMSIKKIACIYHIEPNDILGLIRTKNPQTKASSINSVLELEDLLINKLYFKTIISNHLSFIKQCSTHKKGLKNGKKHLRVNEYKKEKDQPRRAILISTPMGGQNKKR